MKETRLAAQLCPYCGYTLDAVSDVIGKSTPKPGDLTICLECTGLLQFDADMNHIAADAKDIPTYLVDPINGLRKAITEVKKTHPREQELAQ